MIATANGMHRKARKNAICECIVGQDPNSHQPHLIKCGKPAAFVWFRRMWLTEVIKESDEPMYANVGAACCQECFDKIKVDGPPKDLEKLREKWLKNKPKDRT